MKIYIEEALGIICVCYRALELCRRYLLDKLLRLLIILFVGQRRACCLFGKGGERTGELVYL